MLKGSIDIIMCNNTTLYLCVLIPMLVYLSGSTPTRNEKIHLEKLSTIYLPTKYENNTGIYMYPSNSAEQTAYDPVDKFVYVVGGSVLHVLNISDVSNPSVLFWQQFDNVDLTDVEFCGENLFVAVDNVADKDNGYINVYRKYNTALQTLQMVKTIVVGSLPDMIKPTSDCQTVVVAVEAEAYSDGTSLVDPEGAVGIIEFTEGVDGAHKYTKLDFTKFNDHWEELVSRGARYIYRENNNPFSNDLEPEYVSLNKDDSVAYISLQENNAIAEVDLINKNITSIHPLGFKNWTNFKLDASDKDQKINIRPWPVMGMYQPDSIKVIYVQGKGYLVTANEGDSKDYSGIQGTGGFNEESRIADLTINTSSTIMTWAKLNGYENTIQHAENLGRLKVSNVDGRSGDTYDTLYTYGGRSISIIDLETFERVYDSGGEIETVIDRENDALFNSRGGDRSYVVSERKDTVSDDKGPEVEDLAVAQIEGMTLLFVGLEKPGFIAIYSIPGDINAIKFESLYSGISRTNDTFGALYDQRQLSEEDPEDIRYISAADSPNNRHLLTSSGSVSGTISIFLVQGLPVHENVQNSGNRVNDHSCVLSVGLIYMLGNLIAFILYRH